MKSKMLLYVSLYAVVLYVGSHQAEQLANTLLSRGDIASLDMGGKRVKPRVFSRSDIKLLSSDPGQILSLDDSALSSDQLSRLFYDPKFKGSSVNIAQAIIDGQKGIELFNRTSKMPPEPPEIRSDVSISLKVETIMESGAVINGRYTHKNQKIPGDHELVLIDTDPKQKWIIILSDGNRHIISVVDGLAELTINDKAI
jgi:hypothetical protein